MKPAVEVEGGRVWLGDCRDVLKTLPDNSVDSVVTDPPYELGFMGKSWDNSGIAYDVTVWEECLRVLKPGGHILAFGGTRTWHRLAVAIEDAGFEIRDNIAWIYGSGFPKSLDVSKAIDKSLGAEREKIQTRMTPKSTAGKGATNNDLDARPWLTKAREQGFHEHPGSKPATPEADKWQGWGTALKPAFEPVVVGRKPIEGTVANNVLAWGVGGLNIDGSRIGMTPGDKAVVDVRSGGSGGGCDGFLGDIDRAPGQRFTSAAAGRWPANVVLDEFTAGLLDEQSGVSKSPPVGSVTNTKPRHSGSMSGAFRHENPMLKGHGDSGGASRFFMVADTLEHDRMSLCKHTNANNVATLLNTIRATSESSAPTNVLDSQDKLNAQLVRSAGIQCDSCATHIAADLVALKTLASSAETSPLFHRSITDFGSSTLTQSLVSLVEKWASTDTTPTMTDFSTLFGCVLLATDELTKPVSLESDNGRSRYIYQAKASKRDRNEGLEDLEGRLVGTYAQDEWSRQNVGHTPDAERKPVQNFHPTVKPTQLMRYLIKLVTPERGTVLDPFTGSGSTGKAALLDGYGFIGAELTEEYLPIIEGRLRWAVENRDEETLF